LALSAQSCAAEPADPFKDLSVPIPEALFHVVMPRDARRDVVVPEGEVVEVRADAPFRVRLTDPETGRTVRVFRSWNNQMRFEAPTYRGDGTRCRRLHLDYTEYRDGKAHRFRSVFLVPPTATRARFKLEYSREDVRLHPEYRAILSNGAGAAAQLRLGWGTVFSQYDAILAANPNPAVPSDRLVLWTRTRCWLQREGYLRELDRKCVSDFAVDPAGRWAKWEFTVPCGMGKETAFTFVLSLDEGVNVARMSVSRGRAAARDVGDQVRLVFRPDVEWRSFHATTKAYSGPERRFPASSCATDDGFTFSPYDGTFRFSVAGGTYHHEPQWTYGIAHPEEAERGQDGSGDLFSPGWISADLKIGDSVTLTGALNPSEGFDSILQPSTFNLQPSQVFSENLRQALDLYIVRRDDLKTVIAGYPWFLDWGRDTFIFLRGMIAAGRTEDSLKILQAFAAFEENGTLPNIIYGKTAGNRDTTDAQLWFIRCVQEIELKLKVEVEERRADSTLQLQLDTSTCLTELKTTCASIIDNYLKGTPNGIHVDHESGLVWSPSHFTWMDTNYPACTPRVGYPVEIQALWISALKFLGRTELAEKAIASVEKYFKIKEDDSSRPLTFNLQPSTCSCGYRDCLAAPGGESAARAVPEDTIRPNQLFLITLGVLEDKSILQATEELLVPGGIRSLNALHPLYKGVYAGDEDTSRKPAYHNGTVWAWPFPLYAEALVMTKSCSKDVALSLLAGAVESFNAGCIGHMSEIADGDSPHRQKGCCAQAWSDSELLRVWLKLGGK